MSFNVQGAKGLTIPEGTVKTIHDKDNRLLWGAVGYNTKYAGDTFQQTYTGKNLWGGFESDLPSSVFSVSFINYADGSISATGTANGGTAYSLDSTKARNNGRILTLPAGTYNLSGGTNTMQVALVGSTGQLLYTTTASDHAKSFTLTAETQCFIRAHVDNGITVSGETIYPMLVAGSTAGDYEPYTGSTPTQLQPSPNPDYPQDIQVVTGEQTVKVTGKNLMPTLNTERTLAGVTFTPNPDGSITLNGTSTEATSYPISADSATVVKTLRLEPGTYTLNGDYNDGYFTQLMYQPIGGSGNIYARATFTLTEPVMAGEYLRIRAAGYTFNNVRYYPQLEAGSTATAYEPYQSQSYPISLGSTELCGIGKKPDGTYTYQDYIWEDSGTWKIHKTLGKVVLDGSEAITASTVGTDYSAYYIAMSDIKPNGAAMSDYFSRITSNEATSAQKAGVAPHVSLQRLYIDIPNALKPLSTWLSTHNTNVYYELATPTDTAITDETLISQLNAIEEWMTRYGYVGTVFGSLPIVIDRTTI